MKEIDHEDIVVETVKSLSVICGLSNAAYQREDGVFVVPLTALGV
jgi:AAA+ superfamily ATPase